MQSKAWRRWPWHVLTALVVAGLIGWVQPAGANNSDDGTGHTATVRPYDASSGDGCGSVSGEFRWSVSLRNILVTGNLTDVPAAQRSGCGARKTTATFTAYAGSYVVAITEQADDRQRTLATPMSAPVAVDQITVRICRPPASGTGAGYCGPTEVFRHP